MATITPVPTSSVGALVPFAAASGGGDTLVNATPDTILLVRNAGGSAITVTLTGVVSCSQGSTHDKTYSCAVGDTRIKTPTQCIDPDTGHVAVGYSAVTSVDVAAIVD